MYRFLLGTLLAFAFGAAAYASAYDDFARGLAANNRDDSETAIAAFTAALTAPDLSPGLVPVAHYGRGMAFLFGRKCPEAVADLDVALKLRPVYSQALDARAVANSCAGNYDKALADYAAVLAGNPLAGTYFGRGRTYWRMGAYSDAASDFAQAAKMEPRWAYAVIWLALSQARGGKLDATQIEKAMVRISSREWPGPVVQLFLGDASPEDVAKATSRGDEKWLGERQCEADFYTAEWWLSRNETAAAKPLLDHAIQNCPHRYLEYGEAIFEVTRLK